MAALDIERGFQFDGALVFGEQDILGDRLARPARKRRRAEQFIDEASALSKGDLVVHVEHGIGRYDGLEPVMAGGAPHDCLRVSYAGGDKIYVPVENIETLSSYGAEEGEQQLERLGGTDWQERRAK